MTFVNERISDSDRTHVDLSGLGRRFVTHWTIDRGLDAFLIRISSGHPDGKKPEYVFILHGSLIRVFAKGSWESAPGEVVITGVRIPPDLENRKDQILHMLSDAFLAPGFNYSGSGVHSVLFASPL